MLLTVNERSLLYNKTGNGTIPVVLLHGGPGLTLDCLKTIHELLPEEVFTVISYNQSGSAHNQHAPFYTSIEEYAEELHTVLQYFKLEKPFLLGHSWGGAIIQEYLVHYPDEKLAGAILVNTFSSGKKLAETIKARAANLPAIFHEKREKFLSAGDAQSYSALLGEYWLPIHMCRLNPIPEDIIASLSVMAADMGAYYLGDLLDLSGALVKWDRTEALSNISIPTLVMSGEYDYPSKDDFDEMVKRIPNAQTWFEKETSHFPMYEQPALFKNAIITFMKEHYEV